MIEIIIVCILLLVLVQIKSQRRHVPDLSREEFDVGRMNMSNSSVIICGLARDIDYVLPKNLEYLEEISKLFGNVHYIFYENDSRDHTLEILQDFCKAHPNSTLISEKLNLNPAKASVTDKSKIRVMKMAYFRNKLVSRIREMPNYDFVMMYDLDMRGKPEISGIVSSFSNIDWDMICAYGLYKYAYDNYRIHMYDTFAYRDADGKRTETDIQQMPKKTVNSRQSFENQNTQPRQSFENRGFAQKGEITQQYLDSLLSSQNPRIPITSGFNGIAFYRRKVYDECDYDGYDCEHICFHDKMLAKGYNRLFMNTKMITYI